ncbi:MAG TPA: cytochrome c [Acidobacteriaceae bacterium]|jgi:cytochrome c5|nr:cytochrome c [Acidobacteriaceae bacterium]
MKDGRFAQQAVPESLRSSVVDAGSRKKQNNQETHVKNKGQFAILILMGMSMAVPAMAQQGGSATYSAKCAMCHGADGAGNTPVGKAMKVNSFKSDADVKATDAALIATTTDGKGKMPAYSGKLTGDQIKDVVAYIRTLQK